jgi:hypothetical protein
LGSVTSPANSSHSHQSGKPIDWQKNKTISAQSLFSRSYLSERQKNPTSCNMTLLKAREITMAENGTHETGLSKTISDVERGRREVAVDYARSSVGLEGFSLSASDEAHAQRFINGEINLTEFVQPRDVSARPKPSHDEENLGG